MKYSEVIFSCKGGEPWCQDVLIYDLGNMGFDMFEPRAHGFAAYMASEQLDLSALDSLLIHQPVGFEVTYLVNEIQPQNWNGVWERNFEPVVVADQCYVRATFHPPRPAFPYEIVIDPKMAFGTGHHQTTSLIMCYLLADELQGKAVLDMGCGTGILAILAAKRGAAPVWAIDNDPVCIDSVAENKMLNDVPQVMAKCGSVDAIAGRQFDTILANINRNVLLDHMDHYRRALERGGSLYVSGFYDGDDLEVLKGAGGLHGLTYESHRALDGWAAARFIKKQ